jgi:hypothetical protein
MNLDEFTQTPEYNEWIKTWNKSLFPLLQDDTRSKFKLGLNACIWVEYKPNEGANGLVCALNQALAEFRAFCGHNDYFTLAAPCADWLTPEYHDLALKSGIETKLADVNSDVQLLLARKFDPESWVTSLGVNIPMTIARESSEVIALAMKPVSTSLPRVNLRLR